MGSGTWAELEERSKDTAYYSIEYPTCKGLEILIDCEQIKGRVETLPFRRYAKSNDLLSVHNEQNS